MRELSHSKERNRPFIMRRSGTTRLALRWVTTTRISYDRVKRTVNGSSQSWITPTIPRFISRLRTVRMTPKRRPLPLLKRFPRNIMSLAGNTPWTALATASISGASWIKRGRCPSGSFRWFILSPLTTAVSSPGGITHRKAPRAVERASVV